MNLDVNMDPDAYASVCLCTRESVCKTKIFNQNMPMRSDNGMSEEIGSKSKVI
jgi:hypothetical protein